jgi:hypothetical protein
MSFAAYFKLSSYVLIASGFLAIAATGVISPAVLLLFGGIGIASWFVDTARLRRAVPAWIWTGMAILLLAVWYFDFRLLSRSLLLSTLHMLFLVAAIKLLTRTSDRDFVYLYLLSFGALLVASTLTVRFLYLLCLILFLSAGISSLMLFEMNRSSTRALVGGMIRPVYVSRNLRGSGFELFAGFPTWTTIRWTLVLTAGILALAAPLFFLLPRIFVGVRGSAAGAGAWISGFHESVELGALGRIMQSDELVMKVKVDAPRAALPPDPKWRGMALEHFDGKSWRRTPSPFVAIPIQTGYFKLRQAAQGTDIIMQTYFLQPLATDVIFGSHKVLAVTADLGSLARDASDNLYVYARRARAIRYSVVSDMTRPDPSLIPALPEPPPAEIEACCLQTPPLDPRIRELAHALAASATNPLEKARALEAHLRSRYSYSVDLEGTPGAADPLAVFLFDTRRGHCEYFASALAVMLRQLGVPARLVNGFRAGTYNSLSDHWTVRQYDAHSWVEAWLPPYGWVEFDPTPPSSPIRSPAYLSAITGILDALDLWWSDDIINFDFRKQSRVIQAALASLQRFRLSAFALALETKGSITGMLAGRQLSRWIFAPVGILFCLAAATLAITLACRRSSVRLRLLWRRIARLRFRHDPTAAVVGFYSEALETLRSRGWKRRREQTPLEFARELRDQPFGPALAALTAVYNRVRFGQMVEEGDLAHARSLLEALQHPR